MFSQYFGNYLLTKGKITQKQYTSCMEYMRANRVKLGLIAESEGLLSRAQANELHRLQMQTDKRFGDLAIEKGYLTEADITNLLHMQGNPYLIFIQALQENGFLTREEIDTLLDDYQREMHFSNSDIAALKVGNLDELVNFFIPVDNPLITSLFGLALRNVIRFISSYIRFDTVKAVTSYTAKHIAFQRTVGVHDGFLGFASDDDSILAIADGYAGEYFDKVDEDSLDAICEFANCINGLHATELSYRNLMIDMLPPEYRSGTLEAENEFYVLPLYILGRKTYLIVGVDVSPK